MALRSVLYVNIKYQQLRYIYKFPVFLSIYYNSNSCTRKFLLNKTLLNNTSKRLLSDDNYNSDTDQNEIEDDDLEVSDQVQDMSVRNILYKNSKDPLISQLNNCASVQHVFDIIRNNYKTMNLQHICQSVLVLWDLQKIFYRYNILYASDNSNELSSTTVILRNYMSQIKAHEDFEKLLHLVTINYKNFTLDELTSMLLYLNRMGVKMENKTLQLMIQRCEEEITNCEKQSLPLTALSRFIVSVYNRESLWSVLVSINAMPVVLHRLDACTTAEDFKLLTICLLKMHQIVTREDLDTYIRISKKLIHEKIITNKHRRTILKSLRFLNQPHWHESTLNISKTFMYLLKGEVNQLSTKELVLLFKIFQIQKEPADMLEEIEEHATVLLSEMKGELNGSLEVMLDLLSCIVSFSSPLQRPRFEKLAEKYTSNYSTHYSFTALYRILYHLKLSNVKICNQFWDKFLEFIKIDITENKLEYLLNLSQKYMHFTSDVVNSYRYYKLEKEIVELMLHELEFNIMSLIPANFSKISSFLIAFCNDENFLKETIERLIRMTHNLSSLDCLNISKALYIRTRNTKYKNNDNLINIFETLKANLNIFTKKEMNNISTLSNINTLSKAYVFRKGSSEDELFVKLINNYIRHSEEFSSHLVKDLSFILQTNNYLMPQAAEVLSKYIVQNEKCVLGNIVDKVLYLCYSLGYTPENSDTFFDVAGELIIRDKDRFSGLAFLQSCLALCYFQMLPDSLVKRIFSVEFLEKLDEELSNCYAKTIYPVRVRNHLMQLNRAVCLDYPGSNVPWFHQKYVDDLKNNIVHSKDYFRKRVFTTLVDLFKGTKNMILEDVYTPYGYHIDFEIKYDENDTEHRYSEQFSRAAIMLLTSKSYTNGILNLKGYYQLKQRHLEILGYRVIGISYQEWKNFYTQESCMQYIKNKIWSRTNIDDRTVSYV